MNKFITEEKIYELAGERGEKLNEIYYKRY